MAKLSALRANTSLINDGEWITVNPDDPFDIKTRGFTPAYRDGLAKLQREAARKANRGLQPGQIPFTADSLPPTVADICQGQALAAHAFLDVRGLIGDDDTTPVTADEYREMLRNPAEYPAFLVLTLGAAFRVHSDREEDLKTAAGNSAAASAGS